MEVGQFSNQVQHLTQALGDLLAEQQGWHQGVERGVRVGMIDAVGPRVGRRGRARSI